MQWTAPDKKDYKKFEKRVVHLMEFYRRDGFNFGKHLYNLHAAVQPDVEKHQSLITLSAIDDAPIYYTLDGSEPTTLPPAIRSLSP